MATKKASKVIPATRTPTARVARISQLFKQSSSFELFMRLQGYSSAAAARAAVCRWRSIYGTDLFPYKNVGRTNDVASISDAWINSATPAIAAKKLGFPSVGALFVTVHRMRDQHGTELFPLKKKHTKNPVSVERKAFAAVSAHAINYASELWRKNEPSARVARVLGLDQAALTPFINEYRRRHGLTAFPYRGLVA
jgi:hypothetical protein